MVSIFKFIFRRLSVFYKDLNIVLIDSWALKHAQLLLNYFWDTLNKAEFLVYIKMKKKFMYIIITLILDIFIVERTFSFYGLINIFFLSFIESFGILKKLIFIIRVFLVVFFKFFRSRFLMSFLKPSIHFYGFEKWLINYLYHLINAFLILV